MKKKYDNKIHGRNSRRKKKGKVWLNNANLNDIQKIVYIYIYCTILHYVAQLAIYIYVYISQVPFVGDEYMYTYMANCAT